MKTDRRRFMAGGAFAAAALVGGGSGHVRAQEPAAEAVLNLCSQDGRIPGENLAEKVQRMAEWGMQGLETWGGGLPDRVDEIKQALDGTPIEMAAICAGYDKCLLADEGADRRTAVDSIKSILTAAGELGSTGLIVVPAFNNQSTLPHRDARKILVELLKEVGDHAGGAGTRVLLEPLNRGEAFFLRQLADGASICRDVDHPAVCLMGDFYHMNIEETSDMGAFLSAGKHLHHVHLASRTRKLPGQDERSFVDGFKGLQMIGYQDYCSFECGVNGDPMVEIPRSLAFLKDQWEQAKA